MLAALQTKALDGYATSLPYTTEAVIRGNAVMLASAVRDAPDLLPFAYGLVYTRPDTCTKQRDKCARVARALAAAWEIVAAAHAKDVRVTAEALTHSQQVSLESKLLEPKDALAKFDGLSTDEFVR